MFIYTSLIQHFTMLSVLVAIIAILLGFFCVKKIQKSLRFWNAIMKIPGPKGYPVIGNILDVITKPPVGLFLYDRKRNKEYYPIHKMYGLGVSMVVLLKPEDVEIILSNPVHNTKADLYDLVQPWLGTGLLTSSGQKWHTRRKILTPAFHFSILQEFVHIFNKEAKILTEYIGSRLDEPYIDVVKPITEYALESIGETSLGAKLSDLDHSNNYKKLIYDIGDLIVYKTTRIWCAFPLTYFFTPTQRTEKKLVKGLHSFSMTVIKNRQDSSQKNISKNGNVSSYSTRKRLAMLDLLIKAKNEGAKIDDEGIREEVDTFMFEGHDTTSMGISYALMVLANQPEAQEHIYQEIKEVLGSDVNKVPDYNDFQEMSYLERCIKECLRLYPPVPFIGRTCGEDFVSSTGYTVPKDSNLFIYIYDLHRNPEVYPDPEKFDPDRFLPENSSQRHHFAYLPFSAGSRNCIGQRYAILEMKAALCSILRQFKLEKVDTPETIVIKADLVLRPEGPIKVKFVKRT